MNPENKENTDVNNTSPTPQSDQTADSVNSNASGTVSHPDGSSAPAPVDNQPVSAQPEAQSYPSAAAASGVTSSYTENPAPQNQIDSQPKKKDSWRINLALLVGGIVFLLPLILIQDPGMMGFALFFIFVVAPTILILFFYFNITISMHNRRIKQDKVAKNTQGSANIASINTLAKILIALLGISVLIHIVTIFSTFVMSIPSSLMAILSLALLPMGMLITIAAIALLVKCLQEKHLPRIAIIALSAYVVLTIIGMIINRMSAFGF